MLEPHREVTSGGVDVDEVHSGINGIPEDVRAEATARRTALHPLGCWRLGLPENGGGLCGMESLCGADDALPAFTHQQKDLVIIAGDLNTTMWSPYYKRLARDSGLANARKGFGILATWPSFYPFLRIPIDHYLVSPEVRVVDLRMGPKFGSDHRPLVADLFVPPRRDMENVDLARALPPLALGLGVAE